MRYFHVPLCQISGNQVKVTGEELHHLREVLRLREGDEIIVLDGTGGVYEAVLVSCGRDAAIGEIKTHRQVQPSPVEVTLYVGLPKGDRMDMVVQKATELGAHGIVPILCERTVPHLSEERLQRRCARWRKIAIEASKQSHRPFFPFVSDVLSFHEALKGSDAHLRLIFVIGSWHTAPARLRDVLKENAGAKKVDILIGPEGGFTEHEVRRAVCAGAMPVSLSSNILRTETAAIAALSIVLYEKDAAL